VFEKFSDLRQQSRSRATGSRHCSGWMCSASRPLAVNRGRSSLQLDRVTKTQCGVRSMSIGRSGFGALLMQFWPRWHAPLPGIEIPPHALSRWSESKEQNQVSVTPFHRPRLARPGFYLSFHTIPENFKATGLPSYLISRVSATAGTVPGNAAVVAVSVDSSVCDDSNVQPAASGARPPPCPRGLSPVPHRMMRIPIKSLGFSLQVPCTFGPTSGP